MMHAHEAELLAVAERSEQARTVDGGRLVLLATAAIAGQVFLLASSLLLPLISEFTFLSDNISELVLGRLGFIQTAAFFVSGVTTLGLAYTIRELTREGWGSLIGTLLIGVYGLGAIVAAFFPTDRIDSPADVASLSSTGLVHVAAAGLSFLCVTVGMFVLSITFARDQRWRSLLPWIVLCPAAALSLLFSQGEGPWVGLMQRLLVTAVAAWQIATAIRARAIAVQSPVAGLRGRAGEAPPRTPA